MTKELISVDDVVRILNSALNYDKDTIQKLIEQRVPCNNRLAEHPTIQVGAHYDDADFKVGLIGVINGLFNPHENGYGKIAALYDENKLVKFVKTTGDE